MSSTEIKWLEPGEEPPPAHNSGSKYERITAELRTRPGRWAIVEVPRGSVQGLRRRGLQVAQRNGSGREPKLYARFPPA